MKKHQLDDPEVVSAVAGGLAGALTAVFVCPLDVLKTRLQVQNRGSNNKYLGIGGGLSHIVKEEGVRGLYRGLSPTLVALLPNWAVYFTVYDYLKVALNKRFNPIEPGGHNGPTPLVHMAAASGAGAATLLVCNPLWVVKTRLQTQNMGLSWRQNAHGPLYRGTFDALTRIAREEGLRGLYSGLAPSMIGVCHVAIQFPLYEQLKYKIAQRDNRSPDNLTPAELVVASAVSKMVASTATYPHEVIRSHMHIQGTGPFEGMVQVCKQIYQQDGIRGFYRGCLANLLRTTPAAALTFTSFELIARKMRSIAAHQREHDQHLKVASSMPSPHT